MKVYECRLPHRWSMRLCLRLRRSGFPKIARCSGSQSQNTSVLFLLYNLGWNQFQRRLRYPEYYGFTLLTSSALTLLEILDFVPKDDFIQLGNAERSRRATMNKAWTEILNETGVRYSCLNEVPGWRPVNGAILDYMHNFYGELILHTRTCLIKNSSFHSGIVNDFFKKILVGGYLLNKDERSQFEAIINNMIWPSETGRLPTNVC